MTRGTITNKTTGQTLTGEAISTSGGQSVSASWGFKIDGTAWSTIFYMEEWDFIEYKPSAYEQYLALKPGTRFVLDDQTEYARIKLDDTHYALGYSYGKWNIVENIAVAIGESELTVLDN